MKTIIVSELRMKPIIFPLFSNESLVHYFKKQNYEIGELQLRHFPDEETYIKINTSIAGRSVIFIATLDSPNEKLLPVLFAAKTARDLGASNIGLIAPYLAYMRQDKEFQRGEGITAKYFSSLLSHYFDWMMTVDPHLHRIHSLKEIFTIPAYVLHATFAIANWLKLHVEHPLIIGPDQESEQWVAEIAKQISADYVVLNKIRKDDRTVEISIPSLEAYKNHTPVLIDDIISTGKTMLETIHHLKKLQMKLPICLAVHAIFADNAYEMLLEAGVKKIASCNTIWHASNEIDLSELILNATADIQQEGSKNAK